MASSEAAGGRKVFESICGPPKGKFLETTHGTTHYVLETSANKSNDSPLVVLLHGIAGNLGLFDKIAADLLEKGDAGQVLRYDLYDRGYSESNMEEYPIVTTGVHPLDFTLELHVQQLKDVLEKLELANHKKIILCGHSTGGAAIIGYAAENPDNIAGMILIDSVGLPISSPLVAKLANLPILGTFLVRAFGVKGFLKFARQSLAQPDEMQEYLGTLERNANANPRFFAAIRSTNNKCKGFGGTTAEPEYRQCCQAKIPMHLIWGKEDKAVPYTNCCKMKAIAEELGTQVTETSFDGMPHNIFFSDAKPVECAKLICDFVAAKK
ncbi:Alpha beta hydrolase [Seminavis robusta]|uniref:Alpha beta hydrolase n=1 Tax=Seminavis robusta TaxID=568900 RepID=A0A9N8EHC7_9STRA|nr:Alpha beta hydrolase [Seminavis robusta]|eukprot:Sro951_g223920.1 Alpha beta hydrolase (324) ;mRNA; f:26694-27665